MIDVDAVFCDVDDVCQVFLPAWQRQLLTSGDRRRQRPSRLTLSEILSILPVVPEPTRPRRVSALAQ